MALLPRPSPHPHYRRMRPGPRLWQALLSAPLLMVAASLPAGCRAPPDGAARLERAVLEAERAALLDYLATPADTSLAAFGEALVVVQGALLHDLLHASLPFSRELDRYVINVDAVRLNFRDGLALVELSGSATLAARPEVGVGVTLHGLLEFGDVAGDAARLDAHVRVIGLDAHALGLGRLTGPASRLARELGRRQIDDFNEVLGAIEIPLQLEESFSIPRVESGGIVIEEATLPLAFRLEEVRVLHDRVLISLAVDVLPEPIT